MRRRLEYLIEDCRVDASVVAPVPWFPFGSKRFGSYSTFARVARFELLREIEVHHPRFAVVPKLSWPLSPWLMYRAIRELVRVLHAKQPIDVIDAHFFYPDGVAATLLGRELNLPVSITARGSDIVLYPQFRASRRWIEWAIEHGNALIAVSTDLRRRLIALGAPADKVSVLRNGVDTRSFRPVPREQARAQLDIDGEVLLSIGNLVELKGHHLAIEALVELPECQLIIVGEGPELRRLKRLGIALGLNHRIRYVGHVSPEELCIYYSAADSTPPSP